MAPESEQSLRKPRRRLRRIPLWRSRSRILLTHWCERSHCDGQQQSRSGVSVLQRVRWAMCCCAQGCNLVTQCWPMSQRAGAIDLQNVPLLSRNILCWPPQAIPVRPRLGHQYNPGPEPADRLVCARRGGYPGPAAGRAPSEHAEPADRRRTLPVRRCTVGGDCAMCPVSCSGGPRTERGLPHIFESHWAEDRCPLPSSGARKQRPSARGACHVWGSGLQTARCPASLACDSLDIRPAWPVQAAPG